MSTDIFRFAFLATAGTMFLATPTAWSCPAFVPASLLPTTLSRGQPASIRMFKFGDGTPEASWTNIATQMDPLTKDGLLDTKRTGKNTNLIVTNDDRLVFETKNFGKKYDITAALPCGATEVTEVKALDRPAGSEFAYLMACKETSSIPLTMSPLVSHDPAHHRVDTDRYSYEYHPTNQLLFRNLTVRFPDKGPLTAGTNSDFLFRLDLKRFFTMKFGNDDVESYVESSHFGDVGVAAVVNFYIKVMIFKVDLKMATMASFFQDSSHIPMIIDVPLPSENHLNPGSGLLYTFKPMNARFDIEGPGSTVPMVSTDRIKMGFQELSKDSEKPCVDDSCFYKLKGTVDTKPFTVDVVVPRAAARRGFYPQLVTDVSAFKKTMGWGAPSPSDEGLLGFYYENSGLEKGRFQMSYWIGLTDDSSSGRCPSPVEIKETLRADDIAESKQLKSKSGH